MVSTSYVTQTTTFEPIEMKTETELMAFSHRQRGKKDISLMHLDKTQNKPHTQTEKDSEEQQWALLHLFQEFYSRLEEEMDIIRVATNTGVH